MLLTLSSGVVVDSIRRDARAPWPLTQSGGLAVDAFAPNDASAGVWPAGTNLFIRGQCDALGAGDWQVAGGGVTRAIDTTTPAPFSPQSVAITCNGAAANQGCAARSVAALAAAPGTSGVGSVYFKGVAGQSYRAFLQWFNTDASFTTGAMSVFNATGDWQLVTPAAVAVAAGKTGDALQVRVDIDGTRAEVLSFAHAMLQSGPVLVQPYVPTSGATASVAAGRIRADASLIDETQGWVAIWLRNGYPTTLGSPFAPNSPVAFCFSDNAVDRIAFVSTAGANAWRCQRSAGGSTGTATSGAVSVAAGDYTLIVGRWTAALIGISVDGVAFVDVADANIPVLAATTFDLGSSASCTGTYGLTMVDGEIAWAATGLGTLTNAGVAALYAQLAAGYKPWPSQLPAAAGCTATLRFKNDGTAVMLPEPYEIDGRHPHGRYRRQPRLGG